MVDSSQHTPYTEHLTGDEDNSEREKEPEDNIDLDKSTEKFLQLAFLETASTQPRKKWLEKFPRPACDSSNPPTIVKPIY